MIAPDVIADERKAEAQLRRVRKAQRAKAKARESETWRVVRASLRRTECGCDLRPGMTWDELLELGMGCCGGEGRRPGHCCPTLDLYRRRVGIAKR